MPASLSGGVFEVGRTVEERGMMEVGGKWCSFLGLHEIPCCLFLFCHVLMSFESRESRPNSIQHSMYIE